MNLLYLRVSFDYDFLRSSLAEVSKTDEFIKQQLHVHQLVCQHGGPLQKLSLQIQRSDYMCHSPTQSFQDVALKQVLFLFPKRLH